MQGTARATMEDQAAVLGTINYEVACGYGARLERRYVNGR
jgi:alanine racemase